jgi:hypothetical protein
LQSTNVFEKIIRKVVWLRKISYNTQRLKESTKISSYLQSPQMRKTQLNNLGMHQKVGPGQFVAEMESQ